MRIFYFFFFLMLFYSINLYAKPAEDEAGKISKEKDSDSQSLFTDPKDGMFDISNWLSTKYGFMPTPILITEPAVGYGAGLNIMFLHDTLASSSERKSPPNITGGMFAGTENGTRMAGAYNMSFWKNDSIRSSTFLGRPSVFMNFYSNNNLPNEVSINMHLEGWLFYQELLFRYKDTNLFLGANYMYSTVDTAPSESTGLPSVIEDKLRGTYKTGSLAAVVQYDSRNSIFTPSTGLFSKFVAKRFDESFGGDFNFWNYSIKAYYYIPMGKDFVLGLRGDLQSVDGDAPFYTYPFISLRGIPVMRYQGQKTAVAELELRWEFISRWNLVLFTGGGKAFGNTGKFGIQEDTSFSDAELEVTKGLGFRYELARKYQIWAGLDVASGPEENALYIQVGSAWSTF